MKSKIYEHQKKTTVVSKRLLSIIIAGLSFTAMHSQETTTEDALRYGVENLTGSARFRGMGGAFGAVGGDMSAINQNPAGSIFLPITSLHSQDQATTAKIFRGILVLQQKTMTILLI
ncbi:MAG: hypothetical protein M0D53_13525 [Flavobacterium sp. JAD_PAG50586_2]|nr:MAG: hypothetical protein M0D53_13525 [Flavobacterium sp. JAD_PAG50586_2]